MADTVALWVNRSKIDAETLVPQIDKWLRAQGREVIIWESVGRYREKSRPAYDFEAADIEFVLSLGGDGTVLEAAREAARFEIPVLGVNYGRLGFLCEVEQTEIYTALQKVLKKEYSVEERLMMTASLADPTGTAVEHVVFNDVVFLRQSSDSMITLEVKLSGQPIASPPSDGLIIATPTGSTAYSLSAGGPVVSPEVEAILITPLAPHALSSRPMVVSHKEVIDVTLTGGKVCRVTFDGGDELDLNPGEMVRIVASPLKARLIRLEGRSFPKVVREKLSDRV